MYNRLLLTCLVFTLVISSNLVSAQQTKLVKVYIDAGHPAQVIEGFGASDAWTCQFAGLWPEEKKTKMADLLFSTQMDKNGQPIGIGLNFWRLGIGAGSTEQGKESDIRDEWRRQESFLKLDGTYNEQAMAGNLWFLNAAKARGVKNFIGFVNSPHVRFTLNKKAYSSDGLCNLDFNKLDAFCEDMVTHIKIIKEKTGIELDYLSPVNEPQWKWDEHKQEGCPYNNTEIARLSNALSKTLDKHQYATKIQLAEAGQLDFLYNNGNTLKGNQVNDFFNSSSANYIGGLKNVDRSISGHSYFTTSPDQRALKVRSAVAAEVAKIKGLRYWMSEYCILGDSLMKGEGRDLNIDPALFIAKLIHNDLSVSNATTWQWWLAVSSGDYKDGLVYIDRNQSDGNVYESKMLWALGNYSRFIPAGSVRLPVRSDAGNDVLISSYIHKKKLITVVVNMSTEDVLVSLNAEGKKLKKAMTYTTSATLSLAPLSAGTNEINVPARSVKTIINN